MCDGLCVGGVVGGGLAPQLWVWGMRLAHLSLEENMDIAGLWLGAILAFRKQTWKDYKFKLILGHTVSWWLAWAPGDPVTRIQNQPN